MLYPLLPPFTTHFFYIFSTQTQNPCSRWQPNRLPKNRCNYLFKFYMARTTDPGDRASDADLKL